MIVVEGPDGAGKTTLIQKLSEDLGIDVAPRVVSEQTKAMTDLRKWTDDNLRMGFQTLLFDRHRLISDPIYRAVLGEYNPELYDWAWLSRAVDLFYNLKPGPPVIIYCLPPLDVVLKNVYSDSRNDNTAVMHTITPIYYSYTAKAAADMAMFHGSIAKYDYTQMGYDWVRQIVQRSLSYKNRRRF